MNVTKKQKGFQKGVVTNPKGRPKGTHSILRKNIMHMRRLAAEKAEEAFEQLWREFQGGDVVAKQIMFKELLSAPKEWLNEASVSDIPKEIKRAGDITQITTALASKLLASDVMSIDEIRETIKVLNSIKLAEDFGKLKANPFEKLSDEQILIIKTMVDEANAS